MDELPNIGLTHMRFPIGWKMAIVELLHLASQPTLDMNTVGDVTDRNIVLLALWPQGPPHPARNMSVQLADGIRCPR